MEKIINFVKEHPTLTAVVAIGVLLLFFWPSSSSSGSNQSAITAAESQAIADATAANANVMIAQDQVQAVGLQTAAQVAMNDSNNSSTNYLATLSNQLGLAQIAASLSALQSSDSTKLSLAQLTLDSQNSAQGFITSLESAGLDTPQVSVAGLSASGTGTQSNNLAAQVTNNAIASNVQTQLNAQQSALEQTRIQEAFATWRQMIG